MPYMVQQRQAKELVEVKVAQAMGEFKRSSEMSTTSDTAA